MANPTPARAATTGAARPRVPSRDHARRTDVISCRLTGRTVDHPGRGFEPAQPRHPPRGTQISTGPELADSPGVKDFTKSLRI